MGQIKFDFTGERYVVTGASSGMGREVASELADSGAEVLALGRNIDRLSALENEYPKNIFSRSIDVCDADSLEEAVSWFTGTHGKLNGGVHAAGISDITPFRDYDSESAKRIMDVNFWAGMNLLKLITRSKYGNSGTSTVLFSSVASVSPAKGMFAYAASKAALDSAVRSIAAEISSKNHRVNTVLPGWVITPMTEKLSVSANVSSILSKYLLGPGKPEDVSAMVLFLLSDASRWITGSSIIIDGGGGGIKILDYISLMRFNS